MLADAHISSLGYLCFVQRCLLSFIFLSPRRASPFWRGVIFHASSRFARSTIPQRIWGVLLV